MLGVIYSFLAGLFITIQGVFNTRVSDKIGLLETTAVVHLVGLVTAIVAVVVLGEGSLKKVSEVNKLYLIGGAMGVIIVYSVMKGFTLLGPSYSVAILLVSQLIVGLVIDTFGLFGTEKVKFLMTKPLGIIVIIAGIFIFQFK